MAKYKVIGSFYHELRMYEDGEHVEYEGEPGENLHPVDAAAKKAKAKAQGRPETETED